MTQTKMKPEVKAPWVEALRSDEFKQGKGALCRGDEFCCLGVLSELAWRAGVVGKVDNAPYIAYDGDEVATPSAVMAWAGLRNALPEVPISALTTEQLDRLETAKGYSLGTVYTSGMVGLAVLNDYGLTFAEIADLIEVHL